MENEGQTPPPESSPDNSEEETEMSSNAKIKIGQPKVFDGKAADTQYWIGSVYAYVALNSHIYTTDTRKIMFALSFCQEGAAKIWALGYYKNVMKDDGTFQFPSWRTFCNEFAKAFISSTAKQDA